MTLSIPARRLTGETLRAAWYECQEIDFEEAAALCGYVDSWGCPDTDAFKRALRINFLSHTYH